MTADNTDRHPSPDPHSPMLASRRALRFERLGGRGFHEYEASSGAAIEEKFIASAYQNILGARANTERDFFFDRCVHVWMDESDIFRDYTILNYETGEMIHYDPPEADARLAHEESVEYVARRMIGAAFTGHSREARDYLLGKLYRLDAALDAEAVAAHALMHFCAAPILAQAIREGELGPAELARYREVSPDDDIVSRLLREGRAGDARIRDALAAIDAAARIDWEAPFAMWPFGGYSTQMTLGRKADAKGLRPAA